MVYKCDVIKDNIRSYIGATCLNFKQSYYNHVTSFAYIGERNRTSLADWIWHLKEKDIEFKME